MTLEAGSGAQAPVWALRTGHSLDEVNVHLATLEAAGLLGVAEEGGVATVYLPRRVDDLPLQGRWEPVPDRDWNEAWKHGLEPVTVGAVTVAPPWAARAGDLVIDPGQAFGTGHHETTTGCLAALQELRLSGARVLDVGTGSGVLAIAAARLGAATVIGVDPDPEAVRAATANAAANDAAVEVRPGSVDAVAGIFDVILANLDTATLCRLAKRLAERLAPDGVVVASGVSTCRTAEVVAAFQAAGLRASTRLGREWAVLLGRRR